MGQARTGPYNEFARVYHISAGVTVQVLCAAFISWGRGHNPCYPISSSLARESSAVFTSSALSAVSLFALPARCGKQAAGTSLKIRWGDGMERHECPRRTAELFILQNPSRPNPSGVALRGACKSLNHHSSTLCGRSPLPPRRLTGRESRRYVGCRSSVDCHHSQFMTTSNLLWVKPMDDAQIG